MRSKLISMYILFTMYVLFLICIICLLCESIGEVTLRLMLLEEHHAWFWQGRAATVVAREQWELSVIFGYHSLCGAQHAWKAMALSRFQQVCRRIQACIGKNRSSKLIFLALFNIFQRGFFFYILCAVVDFNNFTELKTQVEFW